MSEDQNDDRSRKCVTKAVERTQHTWHPQIDNMTDDNEWVDPYAGWQNDIRGKKVLITVQPDGESGSPTGFVVGTVTHQNGDVLHVSIGKMDMEIHQIGRASCRERV